MRRLFTVLFLAAAVALAAAYVQTLRSASAILDDLALRDLSVEGRHDHRVGVTLRLARAVGSRPGPVRVILKSSWGTRELGPTDLAAGEQKTLTWRSPPISSGNHLVTAWIHSDDPRFDADESNNTRSELVRVEDGSLSRATAIARVPDLVGRPRAVAVALLRRSGFRVGDTYEHAAGEPTGVVERQWPAPGGAAPRGTPATLVMGALVSVPRLVGLSLDQARTVLRRQDLEIGSLELRYVRASERGGVLAQRPGPGARVPLRTAVRLAVALPAPTWPLPLAAALALIGLALLIAKPRRRQVNPPVGRGTASPGRDPNEAPERFMPRAVEPEPPSTISLMPPTGNATTELARVEANPEIATQETHALIEAPPYEVRPPATDSPKEEPLNKGTDLPSFQPAKPRTNWSDGPRSWVDVKGPLRRPTTAVRPTSIEGASTNEPALEPRTVERSVEPRAIEPVIEPPTIEPVIEPVIEQRPIEPAFEPRPIEPPRWEHHPDAGQQQATWHPETAQPTIAFELVPDSFEEEVAPSVIQNARSESA